MTACDPLGTVGSSATLVKISMRKLPRLITFVFGFLILVVVTGFAAQRFFFSSVIIESGGTYDFEIGQNRAEAFQTAQRLVSQGRASEIHTWPAGEFHRPFRDDEIPTDDDSPSWSIVIDPDWWNNSVTLTFEDDRVVRIRRNRVLWELP